MDLNEFVFCSVLEMGKQKIKQRVGMQILEMYRRLEARKLIKRESTKMGNV